jgi:anti-sigma B factor antagonist
MLKVRAQRSGHVVILYMLGQIVVGDTDNLRRSVTDVADASVLILDLARVSRIDAHGLGVLLELRQQLQAKGIEMRLMNVTKLIRQVLQITKLEAVFEFTTEMRTAAAKANALKAKPATKRNDSSEFVLAYYE